MRWKPSGKVCSRKRQMKGNHEPQKTEIANCRKTHVQPALSCKSDYFIRAKLPSLLRRAGILHRRLHSFCVPLLLRPLDARPPNPLAEIEHNGRHEDGAHHKGVKQNAECHSEADLD